MSRMATDVEQPDDKLMPSSHRRRDSDATRLRDRVGVASACELSLHSAVVTR